MPTIDIIIRNKTASAVNPPCIVCGNSDYNVKFDFDEEWQAHNNKIGVFAYNRCGEWQSEKVLFEGDTCPVPALHGVRSVWIGVTAGDVRTSTPADVPCRMGATDFSDTDEPPSADVWGQILAKLGELQTEIDEIKQSGGAEVYYAELDGEYPSYTLSADTPLADIAKAYAANKSIVCRCKIGKTAATLPLFIPIPKTNTWIFSGSGALGAQYPSQTFTVAITPFGVEAEQRLIAAQTDLNAVIATVNEAVLYTEQALSNPQKRQARKNIGANGVTITGANEEITPYDNIVYQAIVAELEGVQNITLIYNNDKIKMQYWGKTGISSYALFFDTAVISGKNIVRKSYEVDIAPSAGTVTEHITPAIKPDDETAIKVTKNGALYSPSRTNDSGSLGAYAVNLCKGQGGATGEYSFTTGLNTVANKDCASAFGNNTKALGAGSAAFGTSTEASGADSAAFGISTKASGAGSAAFGTSTRAIKANQFVCGKRNDETTDKDYLFIVGSGTNLVKKNGFAVTSNGEIVMPDPNATNTTYMKARFNSDGTITLIPLADETKSYTTECTANRVTAITAESTDAQYPTAKAVYDAIREAIANLNNTGE